MTKEYKLQIGDRIPNFSLKDEEGNEFDSQELYGSMSVIYFYPKDDTPGCTAEACAIRDALEHFNDLNVRVVGISPDSSESHRMFKEKYQLNFSLLADEKVEVANAFDVWKEKNLYGQKKMGIVRSTFLVDPEGVIRWIERPVKVENHVERILAALEKQK